MWTADKKLLFMYRGFEDVIELKSKGQTSQETFPYHEVGLQNWHKRPRVVYPIPVDILNSYLPLASATFHRLNKYQPDQPSTEKKVNLFVLGDVGLGFVLNDAREPKMSVEAAALYELIQTSGSPSNNASLVESLRSKWYHQMSLFMMNVQTGWRGCFAEHRLWSSIIVNAKDTTKLKTPYSIPQVRGWFASEILQDFEYCVGSELMWTVTRKIAEMGFDGAPDLVLYRADPATIWFVEVKSATDQLRETQTKMMQALSKIPNVQCHICCPKNALKRFASAMRNTDHGSDYDEDGD